jgi:Cu+-exporting ATPase
MTCASCAARIERRLNKLDGVEASVNYATELARVVAPAGITVGDLTKEVEACGYEVIPPPAPAPHTAHGDHGDDHGGGHDGHGAAGPAHHAELDDRDLRQRVLVSAALTLPVFMLAMVPPLQFDHWQWLSLTLAAPVVVWGGLAVPPGRVGQPAPRRGHHGHPHLGGHAGRLRLVALRPVLHRRRRRRHAACVRPLP